MTEVGEKVLAGFMQGTRRHPIVISVLVLTAVVLLIGEAHEGQLKEMVVYLGAMVLSAAIVDVSIALFGSVHADFPVRAPGTEMVVAAVFYVAGAAALVYRFRVCIRRTAFLLD